MNAQTSLLFALLVSIAIVAGWAYLKFLGAETLYRTVASRYVVESAVYKKDMAKSFIRVASKLSYEMALSESDQYPGHSYIPFIVDNVIYEPDDKYILGKIGESTLLHANAMIEQMAKDSDVELGRFKCFSISHKNGKIHIKLSGSYVKIHGNPTIEEPVDVEFDEPDDVLNLVHTDKKIASDFFGQFKTACDTVLRDSCKNMDLYNAVSGYADSLQKVADKYSNGRISCVANVEKMEIKDPPGGSKCSPDVATCSLNPGLPSYKASKLSCSKYSISPSKSSKGYKRGDVTNPVACREMHSKFIAYELSVVCTDRGAFEVDSATQKYEPLEFGFSIFTQAINGYGCNTPGAFQLTNQFSHKGSDDRCWCKTSCVMCGGNYGGSLPCNCGDVYSGSSIVAGPGFSGPGNPLCINEQCSAPNPQPPAPPQPPEPGKRK